MCSFYKDKEIHRHNIMYLHIDEAVTADQSDWARRTGKLTWKTFAWSPFCGTLQRDGELTFSISSTMAWDIRIYIRDDIKYFVPHSAHIKRIYLFCAASVCISRHRCSFPSGVVELLLISTSSNDVACNVKFHFEVFLQHILSAVP